MSRADESARVMATRVDGEMAEGTLAWRQGQLELDASAGPLGLGQLRRIEFPTPAPSERDEGAIERIELWGGESLPGRLLSWTPARLELDLAGRRIALTDVAAVAGIARCVPPEIVYRTTFGEHDQAAWIEAWRADVELSLVGAGEARQMQLGERPVVLNLATPVDDGVVRCRFHVPAEQAARPSGCTLHFGATPIYVAWGGPEENYAVELAAGRMWPLFPLPRRAGWHAMEARFARRRLSVWIDGELLSEGTAPVEGLRSLAFAAQASPPPGSEASAAWAIDDLEIARLPGSHGASRRDVAQDAVTTQDGDGLFGQCLAISEQSIEFSTSNGTVALARDRVAALDFRRPAPTPRRTEGWHVRCEFASPGIGESLRASVVGAVRGWTTDELTLEHARLGLVTLPSTDLRRLEVLFSGQRFEVEPAAHHLGNQIRPEFDVMNPEGGRLELRFTLEAAPAGQAWLALDAAELEAASLPRFARQLAAGHLATRAELNGALIGRLNDAATAAPQQRLRLAIPAGALQPGENVLRIEQTSQPDDAEELDDCCLSGIAIEIEPMP